MSTCLPVAPLRAARAFAPRLARAQGAPAVILSVQRGDRRLRLRIGAHLDEPETLRAAGVAVVDERHGVDRAVGFERLAHIRPSVSVFGSARTTPGDPNYELAKAFAELMAHALDTGERLTRGAWRKAWRHSAPTLAVANLPTLFFVLAGFGWISAELASMLSQVVAVLLLAVLGVRVGWVIDGKLLPAILGGIFSGSVGLGLAILKHLIH